MVHAQGYENVNDNSFLHATFIQLPTPKE